VPKQPGRVFAALWASIWILTAILSVSRPVYAAAGATLPYDEIEAEDAATNGAVIGPDRTFTTLAAEASGRRAVTLNAPGQYVEFTVPRPANSIVIRYSIPDSADGSGLTAPLSLYIDGARQPDLPLTSKYGWFYGNYPFTNTPGSNPHHFYDDVRRPTEQMTAGAKVRLQIDPGDTAPSYTIDLADFEQVAAPAVKPDGYLSIADYGADPGGAQDATQPVQRAVNDASSQGKGLWIPQGTYSVTSHIIVDNVTIRGAGPWYSVLHGNGVGIYGRSAPTPGTNVRLYDFAIFGEVMDRNDSAQVNGIGGALANSIVENVWIEHTKVGMWLDGPFSGLTVTGVRIRNVTGDGINFHLGISNSIVQQSMIRNTGDDGLAMWTESQNDHDNAFRFNTVQLPILANNIAIYGGANNAVTDNYVSDTVTQGGGIHIGNRFNSVPLSGTNLVARNRFVRAGSFDPNWRFGVGAIWFYALDSAMTGTINVDDNLIDDSSYAAVQFIGSRVTNVTFNNDLINHAGTYALQLQSKGSATFNRVAVTGLGADSIFNCQGSQFSITWGQGNVGWDTKAFCGPWPKPVYTLSPTPSR
jgi:Pectate lyase superfamily protein